MVRRGKGRGFLDEAKLVSTSFLYHTHTPWISKSFYLYIVSPFRICQVSFSSFIFGSIGS